jgi:hypothetical protein
MNDDETGDLIADFLMGVIGVLAIVCAVLPVAFL